MNMHINALIDISALHLDLDASNGKLVNPIRWVSYIIFMTEGHYTYSFPSGKMQVKKDCVLIISPNDPFSAMQVVPSDIIRVQFISDKPLKSSVIDCAGDPRFAALFRKLVQYQNLNQDRSRYMALSILYEILALIAEKKDAQYHQISKNVPFFEARDLLVKNYSDPNLNTADFAEKYGFSDKYFREHFRELFGSTPTQYLITLRLNEAARLLTCGTHNVKQAALAAGFSDIYYFGRLFKKRFKCPPSNFITKPSE